jgi:YceI-like domain
VKAGRGRRTVRDVAELAGTYELGPGSGRVLVRTGREGLASRVGHDLTLEVTSWSARVVVPPSGDLGAASVTASLDLGSLTVRAGSGGAKPLTDRDRREIEKQARKILGPAAAASFASAKVSPVSGEIEGTLTLRGTAREFRFPVTEAGPGHYQGRATLKQTDFGITPYSGFFGALKLRDELTVEFEVTVALGDDDGFAAGVAGAGARDRAGGLP